MNFELIVGQNIILSGDLFVAMVVAVFLFIFFAYIAKLVWNKLRAYETMKYEFVTIIAHKFRTPLTQIKWILESTLPEEQDSFKKENLQNIGVAAKTLINLTNTLVEIADSSQKGAASYAFGNFNIVEVTNKITNSLKERFHEKNIFFGVESSDPEILVKIDRERMEFVLQTLIENSINYSPSGRSVQIYIVKLKRKVSISVQDQGIGIDASDLPRIFTKFFRSSNARVMDTEGFGVGLFLAQSIVKRHKHSKLEVFSDGIGKGTTFVLTLPVVG